MVLFKSSKPSVNTPSQQPTSRILSDHNLPQTGDWSVYTSLSRSLQCFREENHADLPYRHVSIPVGGRPVSNLYFTDDRDLIKEGARGAVCGGGGRQQQGNGRPEDQTDHQCQQAGCKSAQKHPSIL